MTGRRTLIALAVAALVAAAGCGSEEQAVKIGVLADCQGALRGFQDAQLSGADLPFLRRGAHLLGSSPSGGVSPIEVGGRRVELVQGCEETGEHVVFIDEARRLLETEHVDVVVGGSSVVTRELAHRYPKAVFVSTFWDEPEITLRKPAANLFRFSPDFAQQEAGLGAYAYHELGWRRASVVAGEQSSGWAGAAAFTAEFCALGGKVVATGFRSPYTGTPDVVAQALAVRPDGVATFLNFLDDPAKLIGSLATSLGDPKRLLVWGTNLEDAALLGALGRKVDGVVGTSWLPASPPSPALRDYRRRWRAAFPGLPAPIADQSKVIDYHNSVEATLTALERVRSGDVGEGLKTELRRLRLDLPGGTVTLDRNRQAVRDGYLSRIVVDGGRTTLEPVKVVPRVEQSFRGLLSSAPAPGPGSQPCKKATPPSWAE
jgi:ABC-type branched-subunit amino acid transport system substrate-binding protein